MDITEEKLTGIEISYAEMRAVSLTADGKILASRQSPFDRTRETAPQVIEFINELQRRFGRFDKIGLTVPGLIDRESKRVAFSTHLPSNEQIDLLGELEKVTKIEIFIENDANAAAYGEYVFGAGRGSRNIFYVLLGTGVGGAIIFDGELWRGNSGFAGEFGHIAINADGKKLEDVASAANIVRRTRTRFHQDQTSSLYQIGEEAITTADIVREAARGDVFARMMLERTGTYVGTAVAGVINLLNIEKIIIGGNVMQAGNYVLEAIVERARKLSFEPSFRATEIVEGALGDDAPAVGAALLANKREG